MPGWRQQTRNVRNETQVVSDSTFILIGRWKLEEDPITSNLRVSVLRANGGYRPVVVVAT